ncbi:MAG: cytochrome C oxidase assembly protein [Gammaproteobacteria bacterium]|nr:cytochrome C oxidase assembly protein [Gammaproteobacteria bacterium]
MLVEALVIFQVVAMAALIVIGGLVEGYGYGLSLGTQWPYHKKMLTREALTDPEIWHRLLATLLGLNAVALLILAPGANTIAGLVLIAATALLGVATLHVLAGKAPAFLHGLHGLVAYTTYITYLVALQPMAPPVWTYIAVIVPLHPFLLMIFLGGMVTGQRGYQRPIGAFVLPGTLGQWVFMLHYLAGLLFLLTLAYYIQAYSGALVLALAQFVIGFLLYQAVNHSPKRPGILVAFHQGMALLILLAIVFYWRIPLGWL